MSDADRRQKGQHGLAKGQHGETRGQRSGNNLDSKGAAGSIKEVLGQRSTFTAKIMYMHRAARGKNAGGKGAEWGNIGDAIRAKVPWDGIRAGLRW